MQETSSLPNPAIVNFAALFCENSSNETLLANFDLLVKRGYIPPVKELRQILKWKIGEENLKGRIEDEGGNGNGSKLIIERIWNQEKFSSANSY